MIRLTNRRKEVWLKDRVIKQPWKICGAFFAIRALVGSSACLYSWQKSLHACCSLFHSFSSHLCRLRVSKNTYRTFLHKFFILLREQKSGGTILVGDQGSG